MILLKYLKIYASVLKVTNTGFPQIRLSLDKLTLQRDISIITLFFRTRFALYSYLITPGFVQGSPCTPLKSRPVSYQVRLVLLYHRARFRTRFALYSYLVKMSNETFKVLETLYGFLLKMSNETFKVLETLYG